MYKKRGFMPLFLFSTKYNFRKIGLMNIYPKNF